MKLQISNSTRAMSSLKTPLALALALLCAAVLMASVECDHVNGANENKDIESRNKRIAAKASSTDQTTSNTQNQRHSNTLQHTRSRHQDKRHTTTNSKDSGNSPVSLVLREIYLDGDRTITMLAPDMNTNDPNSVQKFHPNGRYGRRSVNDIPEPSSARTELGITNSNSPLLSLLNSGYGSASQARTISSAESPMNFERELAKALRCNYTGINNLYWCDSSDTL